MSVADLKSGFLTLEELVDVWTGAVDTDFAEPFVEAIAAEEDGGLPYAQEFAIFERVSQAIERSIQAMFILPHSAQTGSSAQGEAFAEVDLTFTRSGSLISHSLLLRKGECIVDEIQEDSGPDGPEEVNTGRRYITTETVFFPPGDPGPITVKARAEKPGYGFNNPLPGTIRFTENKGATFTNDLATVAVTSVSTPTAAPVPRHRIILTAYNKAEAFIPEHTGQYLRFMDGSNKDSIVRMSTYGPPSPPTHGGTVEIEYQQVFRVSTVDAFVENEIVRFENAFAVVIGYGRYVAQRDFLGRHFMICTITSGDTTAIRDIYGEESGASTGVNATFIEKTAIVSETATAEWYVLDWSFDWGLVVTNEKSPSGGRVGVLDELGAERKIYRSAGETDGPFAERVATVADIISPNAIKRAINKILVPLGYKGYLREIGNPEGAFMGFFYDGDSTDPIDSACAYDMDFTVRPSDRFKLPVNYQEMRAFFIVGVPDIPDSGDFGFFYDGSSLDPVPGNPGAYDIGAYDGYPLVSSRIYSQLYQAIDSARAGGVGFDFYKETVDPTTE